MNRETFYSSACRLHLSIGILCILTIFLYFLTDYHFDAYLAKVPEGAPISMFDIHPRGIWAFGIFASIIFLIHWILSALLGKGKVAAVSSANFILSLYYFVLSFTILELINQDYYRTSIFCGVGSEPRVEFDISWPCNNAHLVEFLLALSMLLIVISSLIVRVFLSRKTNKQA